MDPLAIIADELQQRDRERWLACLYAPEPARPALVALLALDCELAHLVATTTEPLLVEIRLAWWRDRLTELDSRQAPAQPLLQALQARLLPWVTGAELALLEDRWRCLLGAEGRPPPHVDGGGLLFALGARLLGGDGEEAYGLGRAWATGAPVGGRTSEPLRPLRALAELAARDAARARAGQPPEVRGSVRRQWRMLKVVALGR